ncbi:CS1 type fimbrial major subunit [Streptomyces sp. NPDC090077]|uniref:CS1 type fimbrial major subunit n=1 Tax=Streptomyces sp. NPDC090077 TaxID=3365938 RepID=UPI00382AE519
MRSRPTATAALLTVGLLAVGVGSAQADGEARHSISLVAHVPTNDFYVVPVDPDLVNKDQDMSYSPSAGTMGEVNGFFDVRNTNGSVHGSLESVPKPASGADTADLKAEFNNQELATTPQMVVGEAESDVNFRAPLRIPAKGTSFAPGDYTGAVTMMFDAVPPV